MLLEDVASMDMSKFELSWHPDSRILITADLQASPLQILTFAYPKLPAQARHLEATTLCGAEGNSDHVEPCSKNMTRCMSFRRICGLGLCLILVGTIVGSPHTRFSDCCWETATARL